MGLWKKQDSGFGIQVSGDRRGVSGVRNENEDHLMPAFCFLLSAFRRLLTPFEVPQVPRQAGASSERDLRYPCFLPTVFEGGMMEGALGRHGRSGQDVTADRGRKKQ